MPKCENCGTRWSRADTLKISFQGNRRCRSCGERQYIVPDLKVRTYALYMLPIFLLIIASNVLGFPVQVFIAFAISYLVVMIYFIPQRIKLTNDQKPLW